MHLNHLSLSAAGQPPQSLPWISTNRPTADSGFDNTGSSCVVSLGGAAFFPHLRIEAVRIEAVRQVSELSFSETCSK